MREVRFPRRHHSRPDVDPVTGFNDVQQAKARRATTTRPVPNVHRTEPVRVSHLGPETRAPTTAERPTGPPSQDLDDRMTAPALTFLAPPSFGDDRDDISADTAIPSSVWPTSATRRTAQPDARNGRPAGAPRMTRGARAAATGMKVTDADIQRCLDAPDDVSPDPDTPSRTRFRRGNVVVVAGADGMVLRVNRRSR
jgi:hypothetical protein